MTEINLDFPTYTFYQIYQPLYEDIKYRYKVFYGGRGAAKSWQIARALLARGYDKKVRILCTREIQRSIRESVHRLLSNQISNLKLNQFYKINDKNIVGSNGTEIIFEGLYRNIDSIKSMEGIDICWVEEAHKASKKSWKILIPTIRAENSEIWISFNPDEEDDPAYTMFVKTKRDNAYIKEINYYDNPYFPDVLREEMEYDKKYNYNNYKNVWLGEPLSNYESRIYYRFDRKVNLQEKEITYAPGHYETYASWDFGTADDTAIIFYQIFKTPPCEANPIGIIINIFDEYMANNKGFEHFRDIVDGKGYMIDTHYCDPTGDNRESGLKSWVSNLRWNPKKQIDDWHFQYTHKYSRKEIISHANDYLPYVRLNRYTTPGVYDMFRKWAYRTDANGKLIMPLVPMHDEYSHPGTSFYFFLWNRFPPRKKGVKIKVL